MGERREHRRCECASERRSESCERGDVVFTRGTKWSKVLPMTPTDIDVRCRCGAMRGKALGVSPETGSRLSCYCRDCQAFARFLGTPGILDAQGGSDIFQLTQSQLRLETGGDKLACVQLSESGLLRFYAGCCRTPIGNMIARTRSPFLGLVQPFMDPGQGRSLDDLLGPVRLYLKTESATAPVQSDLSTFSKIGGVAHLIAVIVKGVLAGKHKPSPFFTPDGKSVVTPEILAPERHEALRAGSVAH
jgi:Family of unknown function (DUF6151)